MTVQETRAKLGLRNSCLDVLIVPWGRLGDQIAARAAALVLAERWGFRNIRIRWLVGSASAIQSRHLTFESAEIARSKWRVLSARLLDQCENEFGVRYRMGHFVVALGVRLDRLRRAVTRRRFISNDDFRSPIPEPTGSVEMNVCQVGLEDAEVAARQLGQPALKHAPAGFDSWLELVRNDRCICVHVRLGDVFRIAGVREQRGLLSREYWQSAFQAAEDRVSSDGQLTLVVFSDEPAAAAERLGLVSLDRYQVVSRAEATAAEDFVLLANARNLIASNSSYSWWAAIFGAVHSQTRAYVPTMATPETLNQISASWTAVPADWEFDANI